MSETVKAHKQWKELMASVVFKDSAKGNQPFREGTREANKIVWVKFLQSNNKQKNWSSNWKNKHNSKYPNKSNLFHGDPNSDSTRKITIASKADKKIILIWSTSKCSESRKTETLCKKVGASNKGSEYFRNCEGISNSFSFSTPATEVVMGNSSHSKRKICSDSGDWKYLEKSCNGKNSYEKGVCKKSVCEQSICSKEKGWGRGQQTGSLSI